MLPIPEGRGCSYDLGGHHISGASAYEVGPCEIALEMASGDTRAETE